MAASISSGSIDLTALEGQLNLSNEILKVTETIRDESAAIRFNYALQRESLAEQAKNMAQYAQDVRRVLQIGTETKHLQEDIMSINNRLGLEYVKQETIQKRIRQQTDIKNQLDLETARAQAAMIVRTSSGLTITKSMSSEAGAYLTAVQEAIAANEANLLMLKKINGSLENANNQVVKVTSKSKVLQDIFSKISSIPIIGRFFDAEKLMESFSISKKDGLNEMLRQTKELLKSPLVLAAMAAAAWGMIINKVKEFVSLVKQMDANITAVANSMGVAKEGADLLVKTVYNTNEPVKNLDGLLENIFITTGNISKAVLSLQDSFGVAAIFSKEMVQSQILLTEQMGFSNEEAAGIQKYFYTSGVTAKGVLDTVTKTNKSFLSNRKLISEIAKVNSEIATSYKNQVGLIANAAVQAAKLGMTLDDTRKISDSLLNFESSIENELKAELLLGKQLNFEKARSLALDGKSAEAAALLVKQTGGLGKLNELNVIQRKALAESIGLSAEELTKFAQQEQIIRDAGLGTLENARALYEQYKASGREKEAQALLDSVAKQQNGEMLAQDIAKVDINKRFEQSMLKLKDIFATMLSGPITGILEVMASILKHTTLMKVVLVGVAAVSTAIATALTAAAIASIVASGGTNLLAAAAISGLAVGGITAAIVSGPSGTSEPTEIKDGAISPEGRLMISTPEGQMFKTGKNDYVYATTTPPNQMISGNKTTSNQTIYNNNITTNTSTNTTTTDTTNQETVTLLKEMVALMRAGGTVNMDGIKVGEVIGRSNISFG